MSASAAAQGIPGAYGGGIPATTIGMAGPSAVGYHRMSPGFQSYPWISPFDNAIERHFNADGLWFRDTIGHFEPRGKKFAYDFQVEWLHSKVRNFTGPVGNPDAVTPAQQEGFGGVSADMLAFGFLTPFQMSAIPNVKTNGLKLSTTIQSREGWSLTFHGLWSEDSTGEYDFRKIVNGYRMDEIDALFLEATGGIGDPGLLSGLRYTTDLQITEDIILAVPGTLFESDEDFGARGSAEDILNRTLLLLPSIPLQNNVPLGLGGIPQPSNMEGIPQLFDIEFSVRHNVETYGAGAHFESDTLFKRYGIQFRGLVGGRYMRINEGFQFRGVDSGLDYDREVAIELMDRIDNDGNFIVDDLEDGGGGGDFTENNPSAQLLIRSYLDSQVESELGGPEFGFGYDFGRKMGISLSGTTRVGVLLNNERLRLRGDNIGDTQTLDEGLETEEENTQPVVETEEEELLLLDMFDTSTANGPTQNAFRDGSGAMHVSPMFEHTLQAKIPIFDRVPVLRDIKMLENSSLSVGWTFLWIAEVAEPQRSIVWAANPRAGLFPTLDVKRNDFYQHTFRLGVSCDY